ncbi:70 kDa neurofilament protein, partial [Biomphalaria pfeifferi]
IHGEPECLLEEFTITCSIDKVYPKALCHFNITYNDSGQVYEHITYHHEEHENGTYYKTSCTYWSKPVKEKKIVTVTLYPNVTGKKTDMRYGKTISLNLLSKNTRLSTLSWNDRMPLLGGIISVSHSSTSQLQSLSSTSTILNQPYSSTPAHYHTTSFCGVSLQEKKELQELNERSRDSIFNATEADGTKVLEHELKVLKNNWGKETKKNSKDL